MLRNKKNSFVSFFSKKTKSAKSSFVHGSGENLQFHQTVPVLFHDLTCPLVLFSVALLHLRLQMSPQFGLLGSSPRRGLPFLPRPEGGAERPVLGLRRGRVGLCGWSQLHHAQSVQPNWSCHCGLHTKL